MNHMVYTVILLLSAVRMGTNAQNGTASTNPPTVESTNNMTTGNTTNNTATPTVNACDTIEAGDVYFTYVQANTPNEVVLFTFEDIPGEIKLYLTDNAWTGTSFQVDEGTLEVRGSLFGCLDWTFQYCHLLSWLSSHNAPSTLLLSVKMIVVDRTDRRHCARNELWIRTIGQYGPGLGSH